MKCSIYIQNYKHFYGFCSMRSPHIKLSDQLQNTPYQAPFNVLQRKKKWGLVVFHMPLLHASFRCHFYMPVLHCSNIELGKYDCFTIRRCVPDAFAPNTDYLL